ncbi:MAG: NifU family protein [bacterium]|nr:NifU family protein [bacterium]
MTSDEKAEFLAEIDKVLDVLREGIRMHAGDVELIDFEEESGRVLVRLVGTCVGCPFSSITLKSGIEETLCGIFPNIQEVVDVTNPEIVV